MTKAGFPGICLRESRYVPVPARACGRNVMRAHHTTVDEAIINRVFRFGTAGIKEDYPRKPLATRPPIMVEGISQRLRGNEYNPS